jgi:DNA-binding response OmpR family regulator
MTRIKQLMDHSAPLVLVVDDDASLRTLLRVLLSRRHFRADDACDGAEAIEMLRTREYAAVLLDLMMPRVNGFEVIWHLKAQQPELLERVTVLTTASETTMRAVDRSLVHSVIRKPFDIGTLVSVVADCCSRTVVSRSPPVLAHV